MIFATKLHGVPQYAHEYCLLLSPKVRDALRVHGASRVATCAPMQRAHLHVTSCHHTHAGVLQPSNREATECVVHHAIGPVSNNGTSVTLVSPTP